MARYGQAQNNQGQVGQVLQQRFDPNDREQCQKLAVHAVQLLQTIASVGDESNGRISPQQFNEIEQQGFHLAQTLGLDDGGEMSTNQVFNMLASSPTLASAAGVWGSGSGGAGGRSTRRGPSSSAS